jgi:hypothetical protein
MRRADAVVHIVGNDAVHERDLDGIADDIQADEVAIHMHARENGRDGGTAYGQTTIAVRAARSGVMRTSVSDTKTLIGLLSARTEIP